MSMSYELRQVLVGLILSFAGLSAHADALIVVCYNWGCQTQRAVSFPDPWLRKTLQPLRQARTPEAERAAVAEVVHRLYLKAAEQIPIANDEPGNEEDDDVDGRMDCIDHSTTTRNMLSYLKLHHLLRWHDVGPYAHRALFVLSHYSATLLETRPDGPVADRLYTVDPWNEPRDSLPQVLTVREWAGPRFYTLETQHHTLHPSAFAIR